MDMLWEQQTKKVNDWLDKTELYQSRVKSMARTSARLVPQDPSYAYSEPAHQVQRGQQVPRHDHQAQAREDRHHQALGPVRHPVHQAQDRQDHRCREEAPSTKGALIHPTMPPQVPGPTLHHRVLD